GLEQVQFAAGDSVPAEDAIPGPARRADPRVAGPHHQRRHQRLHEVELADGAEVFAEGGAAEETVDNKGQGEVTQRQPRRPPRARPQTSRLGSPKGAPRKNHPPPFGAGAAGAGGGRGGAGGGRGGGEEEADTP